MSNDERIREILETIQNIKESNQPVTDYFKKNILSLLQNPSKIWRRRIKRQKNRRQLYKTNTKNKRLHSVDSKRKSKYILNRIAE